MTLLPNGHSYAIVIRDGLLDRIKALPAFSHVARFSRSKMRTVQNEHIPYLACYLLEEQLSPDGDYNDAEPRFFHSLRLGFDYVIQNNDPDSAENNLDAGYWAIMNLLTRWDWHLIDGVDFEGITRGSRRHEYGAAGNSNETPTAELRMDWTLAFRTYWPPVIPDTLEHVHMKTVYPWPDDGSRQTVTTEIDIETE